MTSTITAHDTYDMTSGYPRSRARVTSIIGGGVISVMHGIFDTCRPALSRNDHGIAWRPRLCARRLESGISPPIQGGNKTIMDCNVQAKTMTYELNRAICPINVQ